jgi:hypothetical protein
MAKTKKPTLREALAEFIECVETAGAVRRDRLGNYHPGADDTWTDLGDAYVRACYALGKSPVIRESQDEEPPSPEVEQLVAVCEVRRLEPGDLDTAVHDLAQEIGLGELNSRKDEDDQEEHIATQEAAASDINNGGLEAQVAFLLEHNGFEATRELLLGLEREGSL